MITTSSLLTICISAFLAVFLLLLILAIVMHLIVIIFPEKSSAINPIVIAAVSSTMSSIFPNSKITKIEEIK
ncbi:MAG: hypothetical protein KAX28_11240 [Candidatus Marinimicrobia bacterium]|nr:hypothetical protein [Candidatus Neomarinimicrobiota bacterium]